MADMSGGERRKLLLFLAAFFEAVGVLSMLGSGGTEFWLLGSESCSPAGRPDGGKAVDRERFFHQGLFWRCSLQALAEEFSVWNLWIPNQSPAKLCKPTFLFPFPVYQPISSRTLPQNLPDQPSEPDTAIVYRTFWSIFLVVGVVGVVTGGVTTMGAAPLASRRLYRAGGALLLSGGLSLLAVASMYVIWIEVLGTLELYSSARLSSGCSSFQLSVQLGPSFLLAPVSIFFCFLSGLLFVLIGRDARTLEDKGSSVP